MTITLYWLIFNLCSRSSINLVSRTSKKALPKVSANRWVIFHVFLFVDLDLWMNGSALKFNSYILLPHIFDWHWQSCIMLSCGFLFEHETFFNEKCADTCIGCHLLGIAKTWTLFLLQLQVFVSLEMAAAFHIWQKRRGENWNNSVSWNRFCCTQVFLSVSLWT